MTRSDVLIIGGGVIGAACAYELSERGASVAVIEKGEIGSGCSHGNAGWITPSFALPLPMPGMLMKSLRWMLDADSPLYIQPRLSWTLVRWLLRFLRSMNTAHLERSVAALTGLSKFSLHTYSELDAKHPAAFGFCQKGLLLVAQTKKGLDAARLEMELVSRHGIRGKELDAEGIREKEPSITGSEVCGGVFFPDEAHVEPLAVVHWLVRAAQSKGAKVFANTEVFGFDCDPRRIAGVRTTRGIFRADQVVLATGAWSKQMGQMLKLRIPVLSGKGYAVIMPPFQPELKTPCMLIEKKIAVTPRENSVRLAGTLELVDLNESITARRVQAIVKGARQYLNLPSEPQVLEVWRGLRPCTPDGLPIIGRSPALENLILATGHQMLGLQTAPATGRLVADFVLNQTFTLDPHPFRAERF